MRIVSKVMLATGGALIVSAVAIPMANAQESSGDVTSTGVDSSRIEKMKQDAEKRKQAAEQRKQEALARVEKLRAEAEDRKAARQGKLEGRKLEVCKRREAKVNELMGRISARGEKYASLIATMTERVEAYKESKDLTVANYDALLAEVETKKAAAVAAVEAVKSAQAEFKCDGSDPKGSAAIFKELMKAQNEALKSYKESVVKLLVAVKQSQGDKTDATKPADGDDGTEDESETETDAEQGGTQ